MGTIDYSGAREMIKLVRGFKDILPQETGLWQHAESAARELFEDFGFAEIRIPVIEQTELFARSIGAATDIVEKEMYTFSDRGGESLCLRPEATASVVRAYIEHGLHARDRVSKLYTIGPMFRRERPQKGRYRQFYQINAEVFGLADPRSDVELILMLMTFLGRLKLAGVTLHINSLGCQECRPLFKDALKPFFKERARQLCSNCVQRQEKNPLRVFDCKVQSCKDQMQGAPSILDHLCKACRRHFDVVRSALDSFKIAYQVDHRLVRGLDYYTRTTFEVSAQGLGAQDAVAGGGRYDGLVKALGGPDQPAIGFAIGADRLMELIADRCGAFQKQPHIYVAAVGEKAQGLAFKWVQDLRLQGIRTEFDFEDRSLKSQMRLADKLGVLYAVIVGDRELDEGTAVFRDMKTKEQQKVPLEQVVNLAAEKIRQQHKEQDRGRVFCGTPDSRADGMDK